MGCMVDKDHLFVGFLGESSAFCGKKCDFCRFCPWFLRVFRTYFRKPCCGPMSSTSADPEDPPPDEVREVREVNEDEGSEDQVAK